MYSSMIILVIKNQSAKFFMKKISKRFNLRPNNAMNYIYWSYEYLLINLIK